LSSSTVPSTSQLSTLSLHDALPISRRLPADGRRLRPRPAGRRRRQVQPLLGLDPDRAERHRRLLALPASPDLFAGPLVLPNRDADRKSTRLNSSHQIISYAVFFLKK